VKLRTALKIWKAIGTPRQSVYTARQLDAAMRRYDRLQTTKVTNECWDRFMEELGIEGRAEFLMDLGAVGKAFGLLMRESWGSDCVKAK